MPRFSRRVPVIASILMMWKAVWQLLPQRGQLRLHPQMNRDLFRPRYHFTAPAGFLNDPNGLIQVDGVYHLFYQYHPEARPRNWRTKHWGHATSHDLVTWEDQAIALSPGNSPADNLGCWSGCAVRDGEEIRLYYTGVDTDQRQHLCLARGNAALERFTHEAAALPVAGAESPPRRTFRDPYVWREGRRWRALIAGAPSEDIITEGVLELESSDGLAWRVVRQKVRVPAGTGLVIECPNRFILDGREVLLCSIQPLWAALYVIGDETRASTTEDLRLLTSGSRFYAPLVFRDEKNRCLLMAYGEEARTEAASDDDGWCNLLSLPIELSLAGDRLCCHPLPELTALRQSPPVSAGPMALDETPRLLAGIEGSQCEIECELECGPNGTIFLDVLADPAGREFTRIFINLGSGDLHIDNTRSSLDPATANQGGNIRQGPRHAHGEIVDPGGCLTLRIFIDHSVVDVFTDTGVFATQRAYPSRPDSRLVRLSAQGSGHRLLRATAWNLSTILPRRAGSVSP